MEVLLTNSTSAGSKYESTKGKKHMLCILGCCYPNFNTLVMGDVKTEMCSRLYSVF